MASFFPVEVDAGDVVGRLSLSQMPDGSPSGLSLRAKGDDVSPEYAAAPTRMSFVADTPATWAAMPAADTEFNAAYRQPMGLAGFSRFRVVANLTTPGFAGSYVRLKYSTDGGGAWSACATAAGNMPLVTGGAVFGPWASFVVGAKADVLLSIFGADGNGAVGPVFGALSIEVV